MPLGILGKRRYFIFQIYSQNSLCSLEFFLTYRIQHMVAIFSVVEYYYTTNGNVITPFPYACFLSWRSKDIIISGNEKYKCTARASQSIQESSQEILLD